MARQFKNARLMNHMKVSDVIRQLDISQPTLSAWEGERKSPSLDKLEQLADLYEVSTDFLLGRNSDKDSLPTNAISKESLPVLHGRPVWSPEHGWLLVNATTQSLTQTDGTSIPFSDIKELHLAAPSFSASDIPTDRPFLLKEIKKQKVVWVEPISPDTELREELRGRYQVKETFVENECGNRFYLNTYQAKWLGYPVE